MDKNFKFVLYGTVAFIVIVMVLGIINIFKKKAESAQSRVVEVEQISEKDSLKKYGTTYGSAAQAPVGVRAKAAIYKSTNAYYFPKKKKKYVDPFADDEKINAGLMYEDVATLHQGQALEDLDDSGVFDEEGADIESVSSFDDMQKLPNDQDEMLYEPVKINSAVVEVEESSEGVSDNSADSALDEQGEPSLE